jgi:DNA-binding response OmpR family regulator
MTRMLIIEDDPAWRSLYLMEFGREFEVFEANDGLQALSMLDWLRPDVILLDMRLPRMDGRNFLSRLEAKGVKAPVVVCSGLLPEDAASMTGVQLTPKTSDLRYVRNAVRSAVESTGVTAKVRLDAGGDDQPEWLD